MTLTTSHIHVLKVMEIGANTVSPLCPNGMKMEVLSLHFWNSVAILEHLIFTNHSYNLYKTLKIQNPQDTKLQCYDLWLAYPIQFFFFYLQVKMIKCLLDWRLLTVFSNYHRKVNTINSEAGEYKHIKSTMWYSFQCYMTLI